LFISFQQVQLPSAVSFDNLKIMKKNGKNGFRVLSREEGEKLLDRQARRYLRMSGPEFARKWKTKQIKNPDRPEVMRVAFLLPFGG
jgi:hypothetical protein